MAVPATPQPAAVVEASEPPASTEATDPAPPPWWVAQRTRGEPDAREAGSASAPAVPEPATEVAPAATPAAAVVAPPARPRPAIVRLPTTVSPRPATTGQGDRTWMTAAAAAAASVVIITAIGFASIQYWARLDAPMPVGSQRFDPPAALAVDPTVLSSPSLDLSAAVPNSAPSSAPASAYAPPSTGPTPGAVATEPKPVEAGRPAAAVPGERSRKAALVPGTTPRRASRAKRTAPAATPAPATTAPVAAEAEPAPLAASQSHAIVAPAAVPPSLPAAPSSASAAWAGAAFEPSQVDVRPQVVRSVDARYPEQLRDRNASDIVIVRVLVTPDGRPSDMRVLRPSRVDPAFDRAALAAMAEWRFSAARKRDRPVACWYNVGVPFHPAPETATR